MYRVLIAVDADERRGKRISEAIIDLPGAPDDVEVTILNVFEEFDFSDGDANVRSEDIYDDAAFPESVLKVESLLEGANIPTTLRREHGDPAERIIDVAGEIDADCIAMTGRQRSPTGKVLFGSVTQSVLLNSERPVLVAAE